MQPSGEGATRRSQRRTGEVEDTQSQRKSGEVMDTTKDTTLDTNMATTRVMDTERKRRTTEGEGLDTTTVSQKTSPD